MSDGNPFLNTGIDGTFYLKWYPSVVDFFIEHEDSLLSSSFLLKGTQSRYPYSYQLSGKSAMNLIK